MNLVNVLVTAVAAVSLYIITYYNRNMAELFKAKVRRVGSSLGVLIPKEIANAEKIKEGEEIEVSLLRRRKLAELLKLVGTARGAQPFERDREDRLDREGY